MSNLDEMVVGIVALNNGSLVGRIRLQKIVYLLEQKGLNSGAAFTYHHYGPYAEPVADAVTDAKFWGQLTESTEFRQVDGAPFSVFKTGSKPPETLGGLRQQEAQALIQKLAPINSTVLELAATIHWLAYQEKSDDWRAEIERRKAGKTGSGRLEKALKLLEDLELSPKN